MSGCEVSSISPFNTFNNAPEEISQKEHSQFLTMENTEEGSQLHSTECVKITPLIDNHFEPAQFAVGENPMENNVSEDCLVMFKEPTPSVVMHEEKSYTNLKPSNINQQPVPSLILIDGALSAEPLSIEIDQPENDHEQQSSNGLLLQAMTDIVDIIELEPTLPRSNLILSKMPPLVPIRENVDCSIPIAEDDFLLESPTNNVLLSPETKLLLSEQMRKHVQLLTQMHLFTAQQSALTSVTEECRSMLQDLIPFKQRLGIANLDEALDLVTHWENVVSKSEPEEFCRYQRPEGVTFGERQDPNFFNPELVEMMGESRVFMYPDLLPKLAIHQTEPGTGLRWFSPYEDQLIAMGIEKFIPFCENLSIDWWYSLDHSVSSMISKHMLPQWTAEQIQMRIMNNCLETSPANPIKYCQENKVAPPLEHVIRPFYSTRKLRNFSPALLPDHWQKLLVKSPVEVTSPVSRFQENQLLCIASIASFSRTFPARIVNSRAFAGVPELISSQIPSLPHQHPPPLIPLYQQRHKPVCKRRRFLRDFSTEAKK